MAELGHLRVHGEPAARCCLPLAEPGKLEVAAGELVTREYHERVCRAVIRAGWLNREPAWPPLQEGGAVLRLRDAESNVWLPQALRAALIHWRYRPRNPSPPQPQPPQKRLRR